MNGLELAVILSVVDNASRVINRVQEKLEDLAKAGERMTATGGGTTFAGGLIRAAGDAFGLSEATFSAVSFQDESARVSPVFPPIAAGLKNRCEIQAFAIPQSQPYAYAAMQLAESVYTGLSSFLSAQQAMAATPVDKKAGKVKNVPPPATALKAEPIRPAPNNRPASTGARSKVI